MAQRDSTLLGQFFESLVTLNVRVYAQNAEARVGHLRTHAGEHEVDLIVARGDQRVVAIEVKLAQTVTDRDVRHLRWLADNLGDDLDSGPDRLRWLPTPLCSWGQPRATPQGADGHSVNAIGQSEGPRTGMEDNATNKTLLQVYSEPDEMAGVVGRRGT